MVNSHKRWTFTELLLVTFKHEMTRAILLIGRRVTCTCMMLSGHLLGRSMCLASTKLDPFKVVVVPFHLGVILFAL